MILTPIASAIRSPIRSPFDPRRSGASWTPLTLFLAGEQGGWYDPTDLTTMFQDSSGTTPVTAVEQPVGLWLDKRLGALSALGPELVTNGDFATNTWWSLNAGWTIGSGVATHPTGAEGYILSPSGITTLGKTYRVSFTVVSLSGGNALLAFGPGNFTTIAAAGSYSFLLTAANDTRIGFYAGTAVSVSVDNISIREVPGNHLIQPTSASRPTYSKRYNLLERTQEFDNAAWVKNAGSVSANAATAPDGTSTADKLFENTASTTHEVKQDVTTTAVSHTFSVFLKAAERTFAMLYHGNTNSAQVINLTTGAAAGNAGLGSPVSSAIENSGNGWWKVSITVNATAAVNNFRVYPLTNSTTYNYTGDGVSGILIWGADLRRTIHTTMGMPAYQRVTTATDYDETGFLPRLRFDGADDSMYSAASVNFSVTDEMSVFAGVTMLSTSLGMIAELGVLASISGSWYLFSTGTTINYGSGGGAPVYVEASRSVTVPASAVLRGLSDISADTLTISVNNGTPGSNTANQGTGNYANSVFYVGRRTNSSLPFNGDIFQLIVRGALTSGADLTSAEQYVAQRTGVTL